MENDPNSGMILIASIFAMIAFFLAFITFFALYRKKLITKEAKLKETEYEKEKLLHRQHIQNFTLVYQAEEKEKEKISRNLHDGVLPLVASAIQSLSKNYNDLNTPDFNPQRLKKDIEAIEQIGITLRGVSHDLVPPYFLSFGLIAAIKDFIEQLGTSKAKSNFENRTQFGKQLPLDLAQQLNIYRICLELLNNLNKHSHYTFLTFAIEFFDNTLLFEIQHDGKGISNEQIKALTENSKGIGLKSIQTRVMLLEASIDYVTGDEISSISLLVPLKDSVE